MFLSNEDLIHLPLDVWQDDERRIRFVTKGFHTEKPPRYCSKEAPSVIEKEELIDYIGITYNK